MTLDAAIWLAYHELYRAEGYGTAVLQVARPGTREHARVYDSLAEQHAKRRPFVGQVFKRTIDTAIERLRSAVPSTAPSAFSAPLVDFVPDVGPLIEEIVEPFFARQIFDHCLFQQLRARITANVNAVRNTRPSKFQAPAREIIRAYLGGTPLEPLLLAEVPLAIPHRTRYEGQWILGHPGAGKTQALQYQIMHDLQLVAARKASIVLIDSQGNTPGDGKKPPTLLHALSHLKIFAPGQPLFGKLVYITAKDDPGFGFNIFDLGFSGTVAERFVATHELITFVLTGLMGDEFTPPMRRLFTRCVQVLLARSGATLLDLSRLLHQPKEFATEIAASSSRTQAWFAEQFNEAGTSGMRTTRNAVIDRLDGLEMLPDFERLISHPATTFNLLAELEQGKVIIVDTSFASEMATAAVGRFFLALIDAVSRARVDLPESRKTPTIIYIDELAAYCRNNANHLGKILESCRKQNIAICVANQRASQITDKDVREALTGTSIKFVNASETDAGALSGAMGATPTSFLTNRRPGSFAAHVTGMPQAVSITIPYPNLGAMPMMTDAEYQGMRDEIRQRYAVPRPQPRPAADHETRHEYHKPNQRQSSDPRSTQDSAAGDPWRG